MQIGSEVTVKDFDGTHNGVVVSIDFPYYVVELHGSGRVIEVYKDECLTY